MRGCAPLVRVDATLATKGRLAQAARGQTSFIAFLASLNGLLHEMMWGGARTRCPVGHCDDSKCSETGQSGWWGIPVGGRGQLFARSPRAADATFRRSRGRSAEVPPSPRGTIRHG